MSHNSESQIQHDIHLAIGRGDLELWRNSVGATSYTTPAGLKRTMRYGLCKGSSDLIGNLGPLGRFIALEVKKPGGAIRPEQTQFIERIRMRGGFACIVRSVEDACAAIERARGGELG